MDKQTFLEQYRFRDAVRDEANADVARLKAEYLATYPIQPGDLVRLTWKDTDDKETAAVTRLDLDNQTGNVTPRFVRTNANGKAGKTPYTPQRGYRAEVLKAGAFPEFKTATPDAENPNNPGTDYGDDQAPPITGVTLTLILLLFALLGLASCAERQDIGLSVRGTDVTIDRVLIGEWASFNGPEIESLHQFGTDGVYCHQNLFTGDTAYVCDRGFTLNADTVELYDLATLAVVRKWHIPFYDADEMTVRPYSPEGVAETPFVLYRRQ